MKTKTFLLLSFFIVIGLAKLSAQSIKYTGEFDYWQPVYCNGVQIDYLMGTTIYSGMQHFKDGVAIYELYHNRGTAFSTNGSGEEFVVVETDKQLDFDNYTAWHFNLKGDQGSHYLGTMTWDLITGNMTVDKFVCVENGQKKK